VRVKKKKEGRKEGRKAAWPSGQGTGLEIGRSQDPLSPPAVVSR